MNKFLKHLPHYISLIGIFIAGVLGFLLYPFDKNFQIGLAVALSVSYVSWGVIHHALHKDISMAVVFEYVAISILGLTIMISLILG